MLNVLILAAGGGKRFAECGYDKPKPLISVNGKPMIQLVTENLGFSHARHIFMVQKSHIEEYQIDGFLKGIVNNAIVIPVDGITSGACVTALMATNYIDNDNPLVIANCDQLLLDFKSKEFMNTLSMDGIDGVVPTFYANHNRWSYAAVSEGFITKVVEKQVISKNATVGLYGFRKGKDFVWAANEMIRKDIRVNNEYYVCPSLQQLIDVGKKFVIKEYKEMWGLGIPEDLIRFVENHPNGK